MTVAVATPCHGRFLDEYSEPDRAFVNYLIPVSFSFFLLPNVEYCRGRWKIECHSFTGSRLRAS
ncbi:unnamed protein product [Ixodes pacificus]